MAPPLEKYIPNQDAPLEGDQMMRRPFLAHVAAEVAASVASAKGAAGAGQERLRPVSGLAADEKTKRELQRKWLARHQWRRPLSAYPAEK